MDIRYLSENERLTIFLNGRIDTENAEEIDKAILEIREKESFKKMILDFKDVSYISSAGLRVMTKYYREDKQLNCVNTSAAVYGIFEITGFTDLANISKAKEASPAHKDEPWNDTAYDAPFQPISAIFEYYADKQPNHLAVVSTGFSLTYGELNEMANRIANALRYYNVRPNDKIMILLPRNAMAYAVNMGILKAGAAFVPVSTEYPDERISYIYKDADCRYLITTHRITMDRLDLIINLGKRPLFLDHLVSSPWPENPAARIDEGDLAYCIYTSGSTGKPKGVMITQGNLFNFLHHNPKNRETVGYAERGSVCLANAALTFDVSIMEEFIPLTSGLTVAMASNSEILNPMLMRDFMINNKVDAMCGTPSYIMTLLSLPKLRDAMSAIKVYDLGAEAFPPKLYDEIYAVNPDAYIMNGYGPTEATISCTMKVMDGKENISIGVPNANVFCYIIDENNNTVPQGEIGELLICGKGVGNGYINLPEQNEKAFIDFRGMRGYKSGDLACINEAGEIEFHGRKDRQVKYHGLRIELGEIEETMAKAPGITSCVAQVIEERFLCLYYVSENQASPEEVREYARAHLAHYMVPDLFESLKEMPLTSNKKVDLKALPKPSFPKGEYVKPSTPMQEKIAGYVAGIFPDVQIGADTDLRDIGLTSLNAMILLAELGEEFNVAINMAELRDHATVAGLEELILSKPQLSGAKEDKDRYPMIPSQIFLYAGMLRLNTLENVLPVLLTMSRKVDPEKLRHAVRKAAANHPGLFARVEMDENNRFWMIPCKADDSAYDIPLQEVGTDEMVTIRAGLAGELADPYKWPMFEFRMYQTEENLYLYFKGAHVLMDGESVDILIRDILNAYDGKELALETMTMFGFADEYMKIMASPLYMQTLAYYKKLFNGMDKWFSLPQTQTGLPNGFATVSLPISAGLSKISELNRQLRISNSVLFMGMMTLSMAIQTGDHEIPMDFIFNGRNDSRLLNTFGLLAGSGLLRLSIDPKQTVAQFYKTVQDQTFESMSFECAPIVEIAKMYPEFTFYSFLYQSEGFKAKLEGEVVDEHWLTLAEDCPDGTAMSGGEDGGLENADAGMFHAVTQVYDGDPILYTMDYLTHRYDRAVIEKMVADVDRMVSKAVSSDVTTLTIGELMNG